jgi:hypothetical protein
MLPISRQIDQGWLGVTIFRHWKRKLETSRIGQNTSSPGEEKNLATVLFNSSDQGFQDGG